MFKLLALIAAAFVSFATAALAEDCPAAALRPVIKPGDSWTYKKIDDWRGVVKETFTMTVSSVGGSAIELVRKSDAVPTRTITETLDLNGLTGIALSGNTSIRWTPDNRMFVFPLKVGTTWQSDVHYARGDGITGSMSLANAVVGCERIGGFDAFKITANGSYFPDGMQGNGYMIRTVWYAPAIGGIVKEHFETSWNGTPGVRVTTELTGYTFAAVRAATRNK